MGKSSDWVGPIGKTRKSDEVAQQTVSNAKSQAKKYAPGGSATKPMVDKTVDLIGKTVAAFKKHKKKKKKD